MMANKVKVSIITPVYNEEHNLENYFSSLRSQNFDLSLVEILMSDGGSTDQTLRIVEGYAPKLNIRVFDNSKDKVPDTGKMIALREAKGEYVFTVDADITFNKSDVISAVVEVLDQNKEIDGVIMTYFYNRSDNYVNRFLSADDLQRDSLMSILTPSLDRYRKIFENEDYYFISFGRTERTIPLFGQTSAYRLESMKKSGILNLPLYLDNDIPVYLIEKGYTEYAVMKKVGFYHNHASNLKDLARKRLRNLDNKKMGFLNNLDCKKFVWIDFSDRKKIVKLFLWVIYIHLFIPELIWGIYKSIKFLDFAFLIQPIISIIATDTLIYGFLRNQKGRRFILELLR